MTELQTEILRLHQEILRQEQIIDDATAQMRNPHITIPQMEHYVRLRSGANLRLQSLHRKSERYGRNYRCVTTNPILLQRFAIEQQNHTLKLCSSSPQPIPYTPSPIPPSIVTGIPSLAPDIISRRRNYHRAAAPSQVLQNLTPLEQKIYLRYNYIPASFVQITILHNIPFIRHHLALHTKPSKISTLLHLNPNALSNFKFLQPQIYHDIFYLNIEL